MGYQPNKMVTVVSCVTQPSVPAAGITSGLEPVGKTMEGFCEPIQIPMCQQMPYNATKMPNFLSNVHQSEAIIALEPFRFLTETACSPFLVFFLCVIFTPICTEELPIPLDPIPPCRQVCRKVRNNCEPLINRMGYVWPHSLNCKNFPDVTKGICLTPESVLKKGDMGVTDGTTETNCPCFRHPKLKQRLYSKRKFDFVIRGKIIWTETFGSLTMTAVYVVEVFKQNNVLIKPNSRAVLWTYTSCGTCPRLDPGREYFLLGHEDVTNDRLVYSSLSVGLEWRKKYALLVEVSRQRLNCNLA